MKKGQSHGSAKCIKLGAKLDMKNFSDHSTKYTYATYEILVGNARVARVYGKNQSRFATWFRENKSFRIQIGIYTRNQEELMLPSLRERLREGMPSC